MAFLCFSEIFLLISAPVSYEKWNAFYHDEFHPRRIKKKVSLQLIVPSKVKQFGKEKEKLKYIEIKYFDLDLPSEMGVSGDYTYILSQGYKSYALLIKDKNFAKMQINLFKRLWDDSKKNIQ